MAAADAAVAPVLADLESSPAQAHVEVRVWPVADCSGSAWHLTGHWPCSLRPTGVNLAERWAEQFSPNTPEVVRYDPRGCGMISLMAGRRGAVQRGRELTLEKLGRTEAGAKPKPVRAAALMRPDEPEAVKFIRMSNAARVSGAELLRWLIRQAEVDASGLPVGWPEEGPEELPLTG